VKRLAAQAGAVVVEDAAQAAGGTLHNRPVGTQGSLAVLSFGRGKGLTGGKWRCPPGPRRRWRAGHGAGAWAAG
jgi:hypothetical protein